MNELVKDVNTDYKTYPEIFHSLSGKSQMLLSWSHYAALIRVKNNAELNP